MGKINPDLTRSMNQALMSANTQKFISDALPQTVRKYLTPERMARIVLAAFAKTPALWACTTTSIVRSVVDAATLGLEPVGGTLAHGYLVPYGNECQFIISYQGLIELARRSGEFRSLEANVVYERDKLVLRYGFNGTFEHEPYIGKEERGDIVGAYCMAVFGKNEERHVTWMSVADIEKRRAASLPGSRNKGPWADWREEMCVKTVIKKAAKLWPKTAELAAAMSIDEGVPSDKAAECIEAEFGEADAVIEPVAASPQPVTATAKLAAKIKKRQEPEPPPAEEPEDEEPAPWEKHLDEEESDGTAP